ncbi:MAG: hypothetical protein HY314_02195 [Acidobacteria bacterium]|nr:hypothetical protein [Acidobacteriota bacterium]
MKVKVPVKQEVEVPIRRITPDELLQRLKPYEEQYGLSSAEFFEKFKAGTIEETRETVEWFIFYETYLRVMERATHASET